MRRRSLYKSTSGATPKFILNPEWSQTDEGRHEREWIKDQLAGINESVEDYFPEDYGKKLPEEGAWIMLLMSVHVGKAIEMGKAERITVPHLSIWFAMPTVANTSFFDVKPTQAVIQTPQGPVHVWPHEYILVSDETLATYLSIGEEEGFYTHFLSETTGGFNADRLHYIMSRGIPKAIAQRMLLPELKDPFFCYFTFDPAYSDYFGEGFGTPYLTSVNHQRRRQSRKLKQKRGEHGSIQENC